MALLSALDLVELLWDIDQLLSGLAGHLQPPRHWSRLGKKRQKDKKTTKKDKKTLIKTHRKTFSASILPCKLKLSPIGDENGWDLPSSFATWDPLPTPTQPQAAESLCCKQNAKWAAWDVEQKTGEGVHGKQNAEERGVFKLQQGGKAREPVRSSDKGEKSWLWWWWSSSWSWSSSPSWSSSS